MSDAEPHGPGSASVSDLAGLLLDARRSRVAIDEVPPGCIPADDAEASAVDDAVAAGLGLPVRGWKIGCTSEHAQAMLGASGPFAGRVYDVRADGAEIGPDALWAEPNLEGEFAFTIGDDLTPVDRPRTRDEIVGAVASIHPAIEMVGGRYARFVGTPLRCLIADAGANTLLVLGPGVAPAEVDLGALASVAATMTVDGHVTGSGTGADVLGDPIEALRWLVAHLGSRDIGLDAGSVVTTGTATQVSALPIGSTATATLDGIGSVTVHRIPG